MNNKTYFWLFYCFLKENTSEEFLVKTIRAANAKPNADYFLDTNVNKDDFDLINPFKLESESPLQNKHLASATDTEIPQVFIQKNINVASLKPISDNRINSTIFQSPTSKRRTCEYYESSEKIKDRKWALKKKSKEIYKMYICF